MTAQNEFRTCERVFFENFKFDTAVDVNKRLKKLFVLHFQAFLA